MSCLYSREALLWISRTPVSDTVEQVWGPMSDYEGFGELAFFC